MGLNIKNADVEQDIRRLAELRGESLTDAIGHAVREAIDRCEGKTRRPFASNEELFAYLRSIEPSPTFTSDHRDLYDEDGLPAW